MNRTINDAFAVLAEGDMEEQLLALQQYVNALPTVAFKTVTDGTNSAVADAKDDVLTVVGTNDVTVTVDAAADKITISGATLKNAIGTLSNLATTDKSSLVGAVNEVFASAGIALSAIGTMADLYEGYTDLVNAINKLEQRVAALEA